MPKAFLQLELLMINWLRLINHGVCVSTHGKLKKGFLSFSGTDADTGLAVSLAVCKHQNYRLL